MNIIKFYLPKDGYNIFTLHYWDPLHHHILTFYLYNMIYFRFSCLSNNMHSAILKYLRTMFADLFPWLHSQKFPIGFVEKKDISLVVSNNSPLIKIFKNKPKYPIIIQFIQKSFLIVHIKYFPLQCHQYY